MATKANVEAHTIKATASVFLQAILSNIALKDLSATVINTAVKHSYSISKRFHDMEVAEHTDTSDTDQPAGS